MRLEKTVEELRRSNLNLEEFAYAASHDMKEPIRKIHFFSTRLKDELMPQLNDTQLRHFSRLENASKRMGTLIDDLLTYSQFSQGDSELEEINLEEVVRNVLDDLELEIEQKGATIEVGWLPIIKGNKRQIQQLFQNLISNGLKYSKPDELPALHLTSRTLSGKDAIKGLPVEKSDQRYHLMEIRDNGVGFDPSDAERIFNVFTRLHGMGEYQGTGVGLAIARKVVTNHEGFIWAESSPGNGATFKVLLPAE